MKYNFIWINKFYIIENYIHVSYSSFLKALSAYAEPSDLARTAVSLLVQVIYFSFSVLFWLIAELLSWCWWYPPQHQLFQYRSELSCTNIVCWDTFSPFAISICCFLHTFFLVFLSFHATNANLVPCFSLANMKHVYICVRAIGQ